MTGRRFFGSTALAGLVVLAAWVGFRAYRLNHPDRHGARVERFTIDSKLVGRSLHEILVEPSGGSERRPLLVLLHGRNSGPGSFLTKPWFDAPARLGERAPDLLLVDGGEHSYYHDRADGRWGSYVVEEAIPAAIRRLRADPERVAIGGISMGGFGALYLALEHPSRFCAAGGHSAALWRTGGETPEGAFDDAGDFDRTDVLAAAAARTRPAGATRVWIDVGDHDPFVRADTELARILRAHRQPLVFHVWPGSHSGSYWNPHVLRYLRFYADALAAC
jgi:S-formylglutathione hydrolase FrmB